MERYLVPNTEPDRVLASVRRVHSIVKHPTADKLSLLNISVLGQPTEACGWQLIVNHEQTTFRPGDLVVYVEIDAVLPMDRPEFAFLKERCRGRVKTITLLKEISQGLVFPLSLLGPEEVHEGQDVTRTLNIRKYVPLDERDSYTMGGSNSLPFPSDLCQRTEEVRIQNTNLNEWKEAAQDVVFTEKLHGTSATFLFDAQGKLTHVCSRNFIKSEDDSVWWLVARQILKTMNDERVATAFRSWCPLVLQGEICGPNINDNMYKLPQPQFYVFTTADWSFHRHSRAQTEQVAQVLTLSTVPIVANHVDASALKPTDVLIQYAEGPSLLRSETMREGVVCRSNRISHANFSFKALNNQWLANNKTQTHKKKHWSKKQANKKRAQKETSEPKSQLK